MAMKLLAKLAKNSRSAKKTRKRTKPLKPKLNPLHRPEGMSLDAWQVELRRQFGREQKFRLRNVGDDPIFSDFDVTNPQSHSTYRVSIRGRELGENFCTCPDFATNTLGTCKHIEFTLAALERKRERRQRLREGFQPDYSEVFLHYGSQREVRFRPGTECPIALARLAESFFGSEGVLLDEACDRFEDFLAQSNEIDHELRCREDVLQYVAEVRDANVRKQRLGEAFPRGHRSPALKKLLKETLFDYQAEGALFAAQAGRSLIADEMGLGKTIQALAATEIMARHLSVQRVLILCPTSLKYQWQREIQRFTDRSVEVVSGLRGRRQAQFQADAFFKILNYDTVHADLDMIQAWDPDLVILDEAQRIKNWSTRVARSVKKITSPYAIVLTGTPLENRLEELISIVQFVDRYRLGPTFRLLNAHQTRDENGKVVGYRDLDKIGATLEPILIRRKKDLVAQQLPERLEKNFFVPMTKEQREHHEENRLAVARIIQKWRKFKFLSDIDKQRLMAALQNMRMSCDSTYLLDHRTDHGVKADELMTLLEEVFESAATKVVIFSQWLGMHEMIARRLKERKIDHVLFHGGVPSPKRKDLIDRFRDDPACRVFLSTDAGGVGLNLQFASVVINMDLPWNPAVLEQRIGRVHRLGQKRAVRVVNFVSQGTIEEGMLEVLKFKKNLFSGVLDDGAKDVFMGGSRLQKFIESVEQATAAIPQITDEPLQLPPPEETKPERTPAPKQLTQVAEEEVKPRGMASADPWSGLLQVGLGLLEQFTAKPSNGEPAKPALPVVRDEKTGETYVKLPVPSPEVVQQALQAFTALLEQFRR